MDSEFNLKQYENYLIYDEPIPYKNLLIYPVKMKDYINFFIFINCLLIDKNKIPNPDIIRMSYLDFIFHTIQNDENREIYVAMFLGLLSLCLRLENQDIKYKKDENEKINLVLNIKKDNNEIYEEVIDKKDFDIIKQIICHQNMPNYDDSYVDPKVERVLQESEDFINRNKKKMGSLEDQIICVLISTSLNMENIQNLTIRKFTKILQRVDFKLHYEIYKSAEMGGMVSFKEGLDHWMSEISNSKYSSVNNTVMEYSELKNKVQSI